jgi:hypothetical protein
MQRYPCKRSGLREQRIGDELYLHAEDGTELRVLNLMAMMIWSLCDGHHTPEDMLAVLADLVPEVAPPTLAADVNTTLVSFQADGLLASDESATA